MKSLPSSTEDIFVREMILHGKKDVAIRAAFPRMLPEFIPAAIQYMMEDPDVRRRIDAGIVYFYREFFEELDMPELEGPTTKEKKELLQRIILRKRKQPRYIRTEDGLRMIMTDLPPEEVADAARMLASLKH